MRSRTGWQSRTRWFVSAAPTVVLPAIIYLALACLYYWPIGPFDASHVVGDRARGDAFQQAWYLHWTAFALSHGHNPLFSSYLNAPAGANLGVNTSMPLLGALGWPVTANSNSIAAFNVLLRLGLALSALSMYLVMRRYVRSRFAAFIGGLLFGFSPYMLAQGQLHVFLIFLPLVPPLIPLLDRWVVRGDKNPYLCGAVAGVLFGLEMWISAEMVAVLVILVLIALIPLAIRHLELVRSRVVLLARGLATAVPVGLLVGGYVVYMLVAGPQHPSGPPHTVASLDTNYADLLSLVVPGRPQLIRPGLLHSVGEQFVKGVVHENGFYLGIPLLAVLVIACVWLRRSALVLSFATLAAVSFILALGTQLAVANHKTGVPMPMAVIARVPLIQEIAPSRFALPIQVSAAVLLALVIDRLAVHPRLEGMRRPAALLGVSALSLIPLLPHGPAPYAAVRLPHYFSTSAVNEIPNRSIVLAYPYPFYTSNDAMLWQTASAMRFRLLGGEIYVPSHSGRSIDYPRAGLPRHLWRTLQYRPPPHWSPPSPSARAGLVADVRAYVASHPVDAVVVDERETQGKWVADFMTSAFGPPSSVHPGVLVWLKPTSH